MYSNVRNLMFRQDKTEREKHTCIFYSIYIGHDSTLQELINRRKEVTLSRFCRIFHGWVVL